MMAYDEIIEKTKVFLFLLGDVALIGELHSETDDHYVIFYPHTISPYYKSSKDDGLNIEQYTFNPYLDQLVFDDIKKPKPHLIPKKMCSLHYPSKHVIINYLLLINMKLDIKDEEIEQEEKQIVFH